MSRNRREGFTLLEVLMVIAILGLLAMLVVPNVMGRGEKAKIDMAKATVAKSGPIAQALKMYRMDVGTYPSTEEGLQALVERPDSIPEDSDKWGPEPYIEDPETLKDPWGNEYQYRYPGEFNEKGYDLWSLGPDGEDGTEDDIGNWKKEEE